MIVQPSKLKRRGADNATGEATPAAKKPKRNVTAPKATAPDNSTASPITFKTIIRVEKPLPLSGKGKTPTKPTYLELEPFEFSTTGSFNEYLNAVAIALPCPRLNLVTTGMQWKPEKPKNADPHPLSSAIGFKSIIDKISVSKPSERTVILFTKPPLKPIPDERVSFLFC